MIVVNYGIDIAQTTYDTLVASDIRNYLDKSMNVAIKPNLVVPRPAYDGATTHPQCVEGILRFLSDYGVSAVKIIESAWVGDCTKMALQVCGYEPLLKKYGVPFADLKDDSYTARVYGDLEISICNKALSCDFLINVPVLKAHCQAGMTCCMKNLKGCIPDFEKRRFHSLGLDKPIAVLNAILKPGYNVVDGICGDLSFEEGGNPVYSNRIMAGRDSFKIDSYCAELIGYAPEEIGYLSYARKAGFGDFFIEGHDKQVELHSSDKPVHIDDSRRRANKSANRIDDDAACSACYSALVRALHKMPDFRIKENVHIGQGFKRVTGKGIGVGDCAAGYSHSVAGCPPKVTDIMEMLAGIK